MSGKPIDLNAFKGVDFNSKIEVDRSESSIFFDIDRKKLKAEGKVIVVMRFLPYHPEKSPVVGVLQHRIQNSSGEFLSFMCPKTLGNHCSICDESRKYYNTKNKELEKVGSNLYRKKLYYANVLIINDIANPDNNGKVFPFRFGAQLYEVIKTATEPSPIPDMPSAKPFDIFAGNNFILMAVVENGQPKYSYSKFDPNLTSISNPQNYIGLCTDLEEAFIRNEKWELDNSIFGTINNHVMNMIVPFNANAVTGNAQPAGAQPANGFSPVNPPAQPANGFSPVNPPVQPANGFSPVMPPIQSTIPAQPANNFSPINPPVQPAGGRSPVNPAVMPSTTSDYNQKLKDISANIDDIDDIIS
jgi:hypothetical protein